MVSKYIFPSMTCGFLYSDDLTEWKFHPVKKLPVYDYAPDKLYHSYMTFKPQVHLGGLVKGQKLWGRVDSFNESGITEGTVYPLN